MIDMKSSKVILTHFLLVILPCMGYGQDWDYEKYPRMSVNLSHLNADIRIDETGAIEGDVLYRGQLKMDDPDSLLFDAAGLDIQSVSVNDESKEFVIQDDKLIIYLGEVFARSSVLNIHIQYDAVPRFGIHHNVKGTIWTSLLPRSVRHWLPVIDHPRVQFTTELVFTHPSGNTMIANGRMGDTGILNVNEEQTTFLSDRPLPASALAWVVGDLNSLQEVSGNSAPSGGRIQVFSETAGDTTDWGSVASAAVQTIQNELNTEYPYTNLKIVILDEDFWETKSAAAGVIFAYRSRGNIEQQIQSGILSQWIGTYARTSQWSDADAIHMIHAVLANRLFELDLSSRDTTAPYNVFSNYTYAQWQHFLQTNELPTFTSALDTTLNRILRNGHNALNWNELAGIIYEETGQSFFERFEPGMVDPDGDSLEQIEYIARVDWNQTDNTVQLNFEAVNQPIDELVSVNVSEITYQGTNDHEVTFTGADDGSVIRVSSGIENLKLSIDERDDIKLTVEKPFMFWIYQLRNDETPEERRKAAEALAGFTDNPDLQLALNDILRIESNPSVYAAIVRSLSQITQGASGMDERFLEYSSSDRHPEVRKAAVEALAYFSNNEQIIGRLQTISLEAENSELQKEAIQSLAAVTSTERFQTIAGDLVSQEPVLEQVPLILQLLGEKGAEESAVDIASTFIAEQFPYQVRKKALDILLQYDRSPENWGERLPTLLTDRHPKIRYRATEAIDFVNSSAMQTLVSQRLQEEYDERVRRALE